jgi:hypothetical protein
MTSGMVYGRAVLPIVRNIEGHEPPVDEPARARAFWLLYRYTSLSYIERQHLIFSGFIDGFRGEAMRSTDPYTQRWFNKVLAELYKYKAGYETGIDLLRQGKQSGYRSIEYAARASEYLASRAVSEDFDYAEITEWTPGDTRPVLGLIAWGRRAYVMARHTLMTLRAEWTYERFQEPFLVEPDAAFPKTLPPAPMPPAGAPLVAEGDIVPRAGIWLPIDRRFGCPNYLVASLPAPAAMSTVRTVQDPPGGADPDRIDYGYERRSSRWELVWEDVRYQGPGALPEERELLGADVEQPNEPLHLIKPTP